MRRVLDPGGHALVYLPNLYFIGHIYFGLRHGTQPSEGSQAFSETFRTSGGWGELLEEAGLSVLDFHPWNEIYASRKVRPVVQTAWNLMSRFIPKHGASSFAYVCSRA